MNRAAGDSTPRPSAKWVEGDGRLVTAAVAVVVCGLALRVAGAPQFEGVDDLGYLETAQRVSQGQSLEGMFPLFQTRIGMAYPLGWLVQAGWLELSQFWVLTTLAECVTFVSLFAAAWLLTDRLWTGVAAVSLYAVYPLAVQQSATFSPTALQVASIAAACALVAASTLAMSTTSRLASGIAAGLCLGLGYLVKEDVAIVVPAIALASLLGRFPARSTAVAVCAGAAAVFAIECAGYWLTTGDAMFRLTATSGLGAPPQDQLQISQIWQWDAFLRSLFLLPVQVGLIWWLGIPAVWMAFRLGDARLKWAATTFLILAAYLQFGSGSLTAYSPLPKTPRYTALVTPLIVLLVTTWLSQLVAVGRRRLALATLSVAVAASVPCLLYLHLTSSERTRNTLAVLPELRQAAPQHLYTDYYGARVLRILGPDLPNVSVWYHARFDTNQIVVTGVPESSVDAYVLLDRQAAKIYTSSYEMALPSQIAEPPATWQLVWTHRAYGNGTWSRTLLETARAVVNRLPEGNPLSARVTRSVADMIDGDEAMLYRVPGRALAQRTAGSGR